MRTFQKRSTPPTLTIYPVNVIKGNKIDHDRDLARKLMFFLQSENLAAPVLSGNSHTYAFRWGVNQAKIAQSSARAFASQVQRDHITTDYALLVEILCNNNETRVIGVEYYLSDSQGHLADGSLSNSDWPVFKMINPTNRNGGLEVAKSLLKTNWIYSPSR